MKICSLLLNLIVFIVYVVLIWVNSCTMQIVKCWYINPSSYNAQGRFFFFQAVFVKFSVVCYGANDQSQLIIWTISTYCFRTILAVVSKFVTNFHIIRINKYIFTRQLGVLACSWLVELTIQLQNALRDTQTHNYWRTNNYIHKQGLAHANRGCHA